MVAAFLPSDCLGSPDQIRLVRFGGAALELVSIGEHRPENAAAVSGEKAAARLTSGLCGSRRRQGAPETQERNVELSLSMPPNAGPAVAVGAWPDDAHLTLKAACETFFDGRIKPASLRAEARRGNLRLTRIGRTDFVTPRDIREMSNKCRDKQNRHGFGSNRPGVDPMDASWNAPSGASETTASSAALASAKESAIRLKTRSLDTLPTSTDRVESGDQNGSRLPRR